MQLRNMSSVTVNGDHRVVTAPNVTAAHSDDRVWSTPGQLQCDQRMNRCSTGGTSHFPPRTTSNGELVTYQFLKTVRYLVSCMSRSHFLNDWMSVS